MLKRGQDPVPQAMRRLVRRLDKANIPHAIMGGMAVCAHGHRRGSNDVDVLLTRQGFGEFRRLFVPKNYDPIPGRSRQFVDKRNNVMVDIRLTGHFPGRDGPAPIAFPDPADVREQLGKVPYVDLTTLIQLKLADHRYQDLADVVNLIAALALDESFVERLHPSLQRDYIECLEEKRRDDEFNARD